MASLPHTWPRLYVQEPLKSKESLLVEGDKYHYLINVMRLEAGDPVRLFNGRDGEWIARVDSPEKKKKNTLFLNVEKHYREQVGGPDLQLCAAPLRRAHFDNMVMKATELGVANIQPFLTERTQVREIGLARLRAIAIEAAEQSERLTVPELAEPVTLDRLIESWTDKRLPVLCAEFGNAIPVAQALSGPLAKTRPKAAILTGPEGGFTNDEMEKLKNLPGILAVRLGPRILRADTAAIAALSCWQALCGDWANEGVDHAFR